MQVLSMWARTLIWEKDTPTHLWNTLVRMKRLWNVLIIIRNAKASSREYWMTYRGLGSLSVVWFGSSPIPSTGSELDRPRRHTVRLRDWGSLGGGREMGRSQITPLFLNWQIRWNRLSSMPYLDLEQRIRHYQDRNRRRSYLHDSYEEWVSCTFPFK